MDFATFTSTPVILAASSAWLLGVAGSSGWRWAIDWRRARVMGMEVWEYRTGDAQRRGVLARVRRRLRKESVAGVAVTDAAVGGAYCDVSAVAVELSPPSLPAVTPLPLPANSAELKEIPESATPSQRPSARLFMLPGEQITEFLAFEIARAPIPGAPVELKREFSDWTAAYLRWAEVRGLNPMPESIFLNLLKKAPGVAKKIERLKDSKTGRVVKNDAGTPVRIYFYIFSDEGSDAVAHEKRESKRQREARNAAEIAKRRELARHIPDRTWAEELAAMTPAERHDCGVEIPRQRAA